MPTVDDLVRIARRALIPPPRLRLSSWIEEQIILPGDVSAMPGPVRLWPFQREIADCIGDPAIERVTVCKAARVGYTTLLTAAIGSFVANDPAPILLVLPAEADARDYAVSDLEPTFAASPVLARALSEEADESGRNTLMSRRFPGGSLKIIAAKSPRNLRRHTARVLIVDEADGMETTAEGSPILLAEKRTMSFADRKIIVGSTPVHEETSHVLRAYAQSDARVFEVPCPECGAFSQVLWTSIIWDAGAPESARWRCPHCSAEVPERHKGGMVAAGQWRATRPEVVGHAGFLLSALVSLHANASWGKLAAEFLQAKDDPVSLQVFCNTVLAEGWKSDGDELDEADLVARAEAFSLDRVPAEVLVMTAGCDVQHDRLELTFVGWTEGGAALVLAHRVIWGRYDEEETWAQLDELLTARHAHALGGRIGVDACAIDAGDGVSMGNVTSFCGPRTRRRIVAIKGASGFSRPMIERAGSKTKSGARLWIIGVDGIKSQIFAKLSQSGAIRFSADLGTIWFEMFASERCVVRYVRGQPTRSFVRIPGRRAESLDATVYAFAARQLVNLDYDRRRDELATLVPPVARRAPVLKSEWMSR